MAVIQFAEDIGDTVNSTSLERNCTLIFCHPFWI